MAKIESTMLPLGTLAPQFSLPNVVDAKPVTLDAEQRSLATVIMFICNHCPYVRHVSSELTRVANDYTPKGVRFIAINSNDIEKYPDDSPVYMKAEALKNAYPFPYLFDETQEVARAYQAACTPDFFVFDKNLALVYRGQLDDSRLGNAVALTGNSLRNALDCLLDERPVPSEQKPSIGCSIKWKD